MIKSIIIIALFMTSLFALNDSPQKINSYFEYDAANGWWWYKEKYKDGDKEFETKEKMSNKEKRKVDKEEEKIRILKSQNKKLAKIKERLEYAFPNITPIYTKNKKTGKKCLTNSSEDCFVFPLQAEAQHVPVMAKWLSKPNPENSKEWLKWQAKYFNHLTNIGYGNKFAYLNNGSKAYKTDNILNNGGNLNYPIMSKLVDNRQYQIVDQLKDKISILIFLGKTKTMDFANLADTSFASWGKDFYKKWNFYFVFERQSDIEAYDKRIKNSGIVANYNAWKNFKKNGFVISKPTYFKKFNIHISPTVVALYTTKSKTKKKDIIWQKIQTGDISTFSVIRNTVQFLIYNKIISAKELSVENTLNNFHKRSLKNADINEKEIYKSTNKLNIGGKK